MASGFVRFFLGGGEANKWVSVSLFPVPPSYILFLSFILSYSDVILFSFTFYDYPLDGYLFPKIQKQWNQMKGGVRRNWEK